MAERFWATLQAEVLDRHLRISRTLAAAGAAVTAYASCYNHRLRGELGWRTTAERFGGTPFFDRGFEDVASLAAVPPLLAELLSA